MAIFNQPFLSGGFPSMNRAAAGPVGGWVELGRTTLGSGSATISVGSLSDKRYYMVLTNSLGHSTGTNAHSWQLNSDTGSNYSNRASENGGTEGTHTSNSKAYIDGFDTSTDTNPTFNVAYFANLSAKEKLIQTQFVRQLTAGATTAPTRTESVGKHAQTSNPISTITANSDSGNYNTGSEVVVLGWDPADTHTNNFWEELASVELGSAGDNLSSGTITAKKYLWVQAYCKDNGSAIYSRLSFNNDAASGNYAFRRSFDGSADATGTSQNNIADLLASATYPHFVNMFIINNSSNEKLVIGHTVGQNTAGAGNAPLRTEFVAKWVNTSNQITEIDLDNTGAGSYDTNSKLKVWGAD